MAMSRKDYTALAEFIGTVSAGEIPPEYVIEELALVLEDIPGSFKREAFIRHAEKERQGVLNSRNCTHEHTRPFSKDDQRPFCVACLDIV